MYDNARDGASQPPPSLYCIQSSMPKFILIVDDSPVFRCTVRRSVETVADWKVCGEASDGIEAVEKAALLSPDLIVMDLSMPRMNGIEAARQMKRKAPGIPIILYTLHKAVLRKSDTDAAGISAIVDKGYGSDSLIAEIRTLLTSP
jgi:DNA-binding NarL/FixJ family response regulator